ncbi:MAG: phosphoribosyltransferase [Rubrobacteraceae bacterium]
MGREKRLFEDRSDAGRKLAGKLERYREENPVILALPRGGAPVGYEVSRVLGAPLDICISRKLGAPGQPELGIGAVAQEGARVLNDRLISQLGIPEGYVERITAIESREVERRQRRLRGKRSPMDVRGKTVILVDDGLATGVTARAAIRSIREQGPRRLVLAVPVCAAQTVEEIYPEVDDLVSLAIPIELIAVGIWYENFDQVSDETVVEILENARLEQE